MAVARGSETSEFKVKLPKGIGAVGVIAVNPTREESNKIFNSNKTTEEISYIGEGTAKNSKGEDINVPTARITLITKLDPAISCNNGLSNIIPITFFLSKADNYFFKDGITKVQVIDRYGRTAWVTAEQLKNHEVPTFVIKNGPNAGQRRKANLVPEYHPAYIGEERLVKMIIALINIPRPDVWDPDTNQYILKTDPAELSKSECLLERVEDYFKGDFSEIKEVVKFQPNNRIKYPFGIRYNQDGSMHQAVYTDFPFKLNDTDYSKFKKALENDRANGWRANEEYSAENIIEFEATPSSYTQNSPTVQSTEGVDPFMQQEESVVPEVDDLPPDDADPFSMM